MEQNKSKNVDYFDRNPALIKQAFFVGDKTCDLHIHTNTSSDGTASLDNIIGNARYNKINIIAPADHNTADGVNEFAQRYNVPDNAVYFTVDGVTIIPAVEITCFLNTSKTRNNHPIKFHVLAYGFDRSPDSPLMRVLKLKRENDLDVDYRYFKYLKQRFDIDIDKDLIKQYTVYKKSKRIGWQTFEKEDIVDFININKLHFSISNKVLFKRINRCQKVKRINLDISDVINLIHASNGIAILAHPELNICDAANKELTIKTLINNGIDGFEITESKFARKIGFYRYLKHLKQIGFLNKQLIQTNGSDFHTFDSSRSIGTSYGKQIKSKQYQNFFMKLSEIQIRKYLNIYNDLIYNLSKPIVEKYENISVALEKSYKKNVLKKKTKEDNIDKIAQAKEEYRKTRILEKQNYKNKSNSQEENKNKTIKKENNKDINPINDKENNNLF